MPKSYKEVGQFAAHVERQTEKALLILDDNGECSGWAPKSQCRIMNTDLYGPVLYMTTWALKQVRINRFQSPWVTETDGLRQVSAHEEPYPHRAENAA